MDSLEQLESALQASLDDLRVSRGERQALREILSEAALSPTQRTLLRKKAFNMASNQLQGSPNHGAVLEWLETICGLLEPAYLAQTSSGETEVLFAPGNAPRQRLRTLLQYASDKVDICVFTITDNTVSDEILAAVNRGVAIRIITDDRKSEDVGSDVERFREAGIEVRIDCSSHHMHHKFAIFDDHTMVDGSYNWTRAAADYNQESLIVSTELALVRKFQKRFRELWNAFTETCPNPHSNR